MFRVIFSNVPGVLSNDELYEYVVTHGGVGEHVVNALRVRDVCSGGCGAVFVDYANRSAAEEALRRQLIIDGSDAVTAKLIGATHQSSKEEEETQQRHKKRLRSEGAVAAAAAAAAAVAGEGAGPIEIRVEGIRDAFLGRDGRDDDDDVQGPLPVDDAVVFKAVEGIVSHHGGALLRLNRVTVDEANATIHADGPLFRSSLFLDSVEPDQNEGHNRKAAVRMSDLSRVSLSMENGSPIREKGVLIFSEKCRNSLSASVLQRNYTRLDQGSAQAAAAVARVMANYAKQAQLSKPPALASRDRFGNVVVIMNQS